MSIYQIVESVCEIAVATGAAVTIALVSARYHPCHPPQSNPDQPSTKVSAVATEAFSETGKITEDQRRWSETVNPSYALFNCQRTSAATAIMLETGVMYPVSIRPIAYCSVQNMEKNFPEVFQNVSEDRGCFRTSCKRNKLEQIMVLLGPGTHAIIDATNKLFSQTGHLFNYAFVQNEDGASFEIIDSYGGSYTKRARENPEGFFEGYAQDIAALVFYTKSKRNSVCLEGMMKKGTIEYLNQPPNIPRADLGADLGR